MGIASTHASSVGSLFAVHISLGHQVARKASHNQMYFFSPAVLIDLQRGKERHSLMNNGFHLTFTLGRV